VSKWPGKHVIGLTGNIATGKSLVCRMLEHLGACTIDADALSHHAIAKGAHGYREVIDTFGAWVLDGNGEIDRASLGRHVFNDPEALRQLEGIIHPLVENAMDAMVQNANQQIIVIEAIKLFEAGLAESCDTVWVTYAPEPVQKARLMKKRNMDEQDALQRIHAQAPQEVKTAAADVVIDNSGSIKKTWKQVLNAWQAITPVPHARRVEMPKSLVS
jgi:dephospho-CoA kinase